MPMPLVIKDYFLINCWLFPAFDYAGKQKWGLHTV